MIREGERGVGGEREETEKEEGMVEGDHVDS